MTACIDEFVESVIQHEREAVIYGAGMLGKNLSFFLQDQCGISISWFCDKNPELWGVIIEKEIRCMSLEELVKRKENISIVIAVGFKYLEEVKSFLKQHKVEHYITWQEIAKSYWLKKRFCRIDIIDNLEWKGIEIKFWEKNCNKLKERKRTAVFTFIAEGYDELHQPLMVDDGIDYYVISDNKINDLGIYNWIDVKTVIPDTGMNPFMQNRYCKMHGADIFRDYDYSIYLDGSQQIVGNITDYLDQVGKTGIALYLNETCACIYEAGIIVSLAGKCNFELVRKQLHEYAMEGMPANYGLFCGGYIFRDNRNELGNELMHLWWQEYQKWPTRDQLCLTYVMWRMGLEFKDVGIINDGQNRLEDKNIAIHSHCYAKTYCLNNG